MRQCLENLVGTGNDERLGESRPAVHSSVGTLQSIERPATSSHQSKEDDNTTAVSISDCHGLYAKKSDGSPLTSQDAICLEEILGEHSGFIGRLVVDRATFGRSER